MGQPAYRKALLLCLVAATALEPRQKPQTQACVDDQGNAVECVRPDEGPGSLQDQFVEKVATARRLKGLEGEPAQPSMTCLLYTSPSPRDVSTSRMPSSA